MNKICSYLLGFGETIRAGDNIINADRRLQYTWMRLEDIDCVTVANCNNTLWAKKGRSSIRMLLLSARIQLELEYQMNSKGCVDKRDQWDELEFTDTRGIG